MTEQLKIVFDTKLMRPGCVILQTVLGGSPGIANKFPTESWLVYPTEDLKTYIVFPAQLKILINRVQAKLLHRKNL